MLLTYSSNFCLISIRSDRIRILLFAQILVKCILNAVMNKCNHELFFFFFLLFYFNILNDYNSLFHIALIIRLHFHLNFIIFAMGAAEKNKRNA